MYKHSSYVPDAGFSVIGAVYKYLHKIIVRSSIEKSSASHYLNTEYMYAIYLLFQVFMVFTVHHLTSFRARN